MPTPSTQPAAATRAGRRRLGATLGSAVLATLAISGVPGAAHALSSAEVVESTPAAAVSTLVGGGVKVSGITAAGFHTQFGTFDSADSTAVGFGRGVVLSTGNAVEAAGPNTSGISGAQTMQPGDPDVAAAAGVDPGNTFDAATLEFDFVPSGSQISFNYVFASEEYPESVGGVYNDAFALLVDGHSCATIPGTDTPVSINTVNATSHAEEFRDNSASPAPFDVAYDGLTTVFTCTAPVNPGVVNHVKVAVADVGDRSIDSAVFLQANSFTPAGAAAPTVVVPATQRAEATGPGGAAVTYSASATEASGAPLTPTCTPAPGSTFPVGTTTVGCTATDGSGQSGSGSFDVVVSDTTAPSLQLPGDQSASTGGAASTPVSWSAGATDLVDRTTPVTCDHASGSSFPVGQTTVTCTSTDAHGNTARGSFVVAVSGYGWNGFAQPINDTGHQQGGYSVFKAGSTVPVKFSLYDAAGRSVRAAAAPVWVQPQQGSATTAPVNESVYTLPASTGSTYAWDGSSQYQYNWSTSKAMAGSYWRIGVRLDDGTSRYVVIALR